MLTQNDQDTQQANQLLARTKFNTLKGRQQNAEYSKYWASSQNFLNVQISLNGIHDQEKNQSIHTYSKMKEMRQGFLHNGYKQTSRFISKYINSKKRNGRYKNTNSRSEKKLLNVNAINWRIQKKRPVFFKEQYEKYPR